MCSFEFMSKEENTEGSAIENKCLKQSFTYIIYPMIYIKEKKHPCTDSEL